MFVFIGRIFRLRINTDFYYITHISKGKWKQINQLNKEQLSYNWDLPKNRYIKLPTVSFILFPRDVRTLKKKKKCVSELISYTVTLGMKGYFSEMQ